MEPTIFDLVRWADDVPLSAGQIQKAYDWRITQWAALGNAILAAVFAFLSSAIIESYKQSLKLPHFWLLVGGATLLYVSCYAFCRFRIIRLRQEFLALYTFLLVIK